MTAAGRICSRFPQVSVLFCEYRQRNRDSPLKISLIKGPTSLVPYLASPLTLAEYIAYIIILEKSVFPWLTLGYPDYPKRMPVCKEKVFFPVFSCHHSLSLSLFLFLSLLSASPPLSYRYFMHGLTQSRVEYTTHWRPSSHWDTEKKKKKSALTCMSFRTVSE